MRESNSFGNAKFPDDPMSSTGPTRRQLTSQARPDAAETSADASFNLAANIVLDEVVGEIAEQFRLREILEEACVATGATGAAIALARGEEMVCRATAGGDAPDLGVCLDPNSGLSGSCIQTRQLQLCTDTETDPRVDPEACRQLGARSIAVLPLVCGNQLLGVFEILSARPNAFGEKELVSLQALSGRILQSKRQDTGGTAKAPPKRSRSSPKSEEINAQKETHTPISDPVTSLRHQGSKSRDIRTTILGTLVISVAILLGALIGCRIGWERATLQNRHRALPRGAGTPSRTVRPDEMLLPTVELQPSSVPVAEFDHAAGLATPRFSGATKNLARPPGGGLNIQQGDRSTFVEPPSAPARTRDSQPSQSSPDPNGEPPQ